MGLTKKTLDQMAAVDVRTVDISTLTDLRDIEIDTSLPVEKKLDRVLSGYSGRFFCAWK